MISATPIGPPLGPTTYNGMGLNPSNLYLYADDGVNGALIIIDSRTGTIVKQFGGTGLGLAGDFDTDTYHFVNNPAPVGGTLFAFDLSTGSTTPTQSTGVNTYTGPAPNQGADSVYNPRDKRFYNLDQSGGSLYEGSPSYVNSATTNMGWTFIGTTILAGVSAIFGPTATIPYGGAWGDVLGNMYFISPSNFIVAIKVTRPGIVDAYSVKPITYPGPGLVDAAANNRLINYFSYPFIAPSLATVVDEVYNRTVQYTPGTSIALFAPDSLVTLFTPENLLNNITFTIDNTSPGDTLVASSFLPPFITSMSSISTNPDNTVNLMLTLVGPAGPTSFNSAGQQVYFSTTSNEVQPRVIEIVGQTSPDLVSSFIPSEVIVYI